MSHHPLTKFEIEKYCQNEPRFNGDYSRNNLPQMKDMGCNKSWWLQINRKSLDSFVRLWWSDKLLWQLWSYTYLKKILKFISDKNIAKKNHL